MNISARSALCVMMRCSLEEVKTFWEAVSAVCTACIYTGAVVCHVFLKFKRGMPAVSSMTASLRV